jgi:hypothetical protein
MTQLAKYFYGLTICLRTLTPTCLLTHWSGGILREASDGPQIARSTEWHWMARWNDYKQWDDTDILGRDPVGLLAPLGGPEPLLHPTPPQMVTSMSPITKPSTESLTESSTESPKPTVKSPFR